MSLTFRSQSLQDTDDARTSRWYFDLIEGLPGHENPEVRGEDVIAPGRPGHYVGNRVEDRLEILIEGFISGFGNTPQERREDWHTNSLLILNLFDLEDSPGDLLVAGGSNSYLGLTTEWSTEARTLDQMAGDIQNQMSFQRWSFRLECVNGLWWEEGS